MLNISFLAYLGLYLLICGLINYATSSWCFSHSEQIIRIHPVVIIFSRSSTFNASAPRYNVGGLNKTQSRWILPISALVGIQSRVYHVWQMAKKKWPLDHPLLLITIWTVSYQRYKIRANEYQSIVWIQIYTGQWVCRGTETCTLGCPSGQYKNRQVKIGCIKGHFKRKWL